MKKTCKCLVLNFLFIALPHFYLYYGRFNIFITSKLVPYLTILYIHNCNGINKDTFNYLIPQHLRTARSIYCPKYTRHATRAVPLCWVMVAQQNVSEFVDSYLNPLVSHTPSYIQDTTDFLRKLWMFPPYIQTSPMAKA